MSDRLENLLVDVRDGIMRNLNTKLHLLEDKCDEVYYKISWGGFDTLIANKSEIFLCESSNPEKTKLGEFAEPDLFSLYSYIEANHNFIERKQSVIEHKDSDDITWVEEPVKILDSENNPIAMMGCRVVGVEGEAIQIATTLVSPDGTYANLTMFRESESDDISLAISDLEKIAQGMQSFAKTLTNYDKKD